MIAIDTNVLVYAHRQDSPFHASAYRAMSQLLASSEACAIAWPCVHEFLNVATHPKGYQPPSTLAEAIGFIESLRAHPHLRFLTESNTHWPTLTELLVKCHIVGAKVHDARIAALCLQHGVTELWSVDRDFSRFPRLKVVNPLHNV